MVAGELLVEVGPGRPHLPGPPLVAAVERTQRVGESIQVTADGCMDHAVHAHLSHLGSLSPSRVRVVTNHPPAPGRLHSYARPVRVGRMYAIGSDGDRRLFLR